MEAVKNNLIHDAMSQKIIETAEDLATANGASSVTVRGILSRLGITNRVFYNRFHNIDQVLALVYESTARKIRESMLSKIDPSRDFFEQVTDIVVSSLNLSYDNKMKLNQYVFESDSLSEINYHWWMCEIGRLIDYAKEQQLIGEVDSATMSYSIWCFCRGFNADAVGRNLPREEAERRFRYSFGILLNGLRMTAQKQP